MSLIKYQNQYQKKSGLFLKKSNFTQKNDTQNSGNGQKMIPKNPRIAQKGTQNSGSNPRKVPKIMAHPCIMTFAS